MGLPVAYVRFGCFGVVPVTPLPGEQKLMEVTRPEIRTFLTFPEWYIVYSAEEYASALELGMPSGFSYFRATGQFWSSYRTIYCATKDTYPSDDGFHFALFVIGESFSVENTVKGIYEQTIGRVAELTSWNESTQEDRFAAGVAREYGTFLHTVPWYRFPFTQKLKGLWRETDLWGPHMIRKWERKIILSIEYGVKAVYGKLIGWGTGAAYAPEDLDIALMIEWAPDSIFADSRVRKISESGAGAYTVIIPRYEEFTHIVPELARRGVQFVRIAGNDEIFLTLHARDGLAPAESYADIVFTMPVIGTNAIKRFGIKMSVTRLHEALADIEARGMTLEHIYDY